MSEPAPRAGSSPIRRSLQIGIGNISIIAVLRLLLVLWVATRVDHLLIILMFAVLIATAIDEPVSWLEQHRVPRPLGILLHYLALIALLAVVVIVLVPLISSEITLLRHQWPAYQKDLQAIIARVSPDQSDFSMDDVTSQTTGHLGDFASQLSRLTLNVVESTLYVFITLVLAFFLASDPGTAGKLIDRFAPVARREQLRDMARTSRDRIGSWARGQLLIALIFGLAMGIGLKLIGVPYAASLGATAAVLEVFPYVGGAITVLLATLTALSVSVPHAIAVIVLYIVLVNIEAHVLSPLLFGKAVGLPPVVILIALLAGVDMFGIVGALLAVPITVILWVVIEQVYPAPVPPGALPDAGAPPVPPPS